MQKESYKMGKLSKAKKLTETEKFCIEGMLNNGMSNEEVANALGRDVELIEELIDDYEQDPGPMTINETASGNRGVTVMTEAGSYRVDQARENHNNSLAENKKTQGTIHKIHE
jgi:hypothetical protein